MKNIISTAVCLLLFTVLANSQGLKDDQYFGTVTDLDGETRVGVIQVWSNYTLYLNQEKIWFFETDTTSFDMKLKKKKMEKFKAEDLGEYSIKGKVYARIQYNPSESLSNQLLSGKKYILAERLMEGDAMSLYLVHSKPPSTQVVGSGMEEKTSNLTYVVSRKDEKAKEFLSFTFSDYFKDCTELINKYEEGEFSVKPTEKGVLNKLAGPTYNHEEYIEGAHQVVKAYNELCGSSM